MEGMGLNPLFGNIYAGARVLVTGHTGFKGSWLCLWLRLWMILGLWQRWLCHGLHSRNRLRHRLGWYGGWRWRVALRWRTTIEGC